MTTRINMINTCPSKDFLKGMEAELTMEISFLLRWREYTPTDVRKKIKELQKCLRMIERPTIQYTLQI